MTQHRVASAEGAVPAAPASYSAPAPPPESGDADRTAGRGARDSLTRRASLTAAASLLDFVVRVGVGFVTTPIILSGLGQTLYGVWEILNRLVSHVVATDGRPTQALRLVVSNRQNTASPELQRRAVGSAIVVWLLFLPIVSLIGALITWWAPTIVKASPELVGRVRLTCGLLVLSTLAMTLGAVPQSVLQGMNLGYKRMGLQAGVNVIGGILMVGAIYTGLGLPGLAASRVAVFVIAAFVFLFLARRYVDWFGMARPKRGDVKGLLHVSVWIALGDTVSRVLNASDVVILGIARSPALVTTYVLTGYAAKFALGVLTASVGSAMPGFGGLVGHGDLARASASRREILASAWLFLTAVGGTILVWNRAFLELWVGPGQSAGAIVNLLIVVIAAETATIRTYVFMIDAALQTRFRVLVGAASAAVTIGLSLVGALWLGLPGLCLGIVLGRGVACLVYPVYLRRHLFHARTGSVLPALRALVVTAAVYAIATWLGARLLVAHWIVWGAGSAATFGLLLVTAFALGLGPEVRRALLARARSIARRRRM